MTACVSDTGPGPVHHRGPRATPPYGIRPATRP